MDLRQPRLAPRNFTRDSREGLPRAVHLHGIGRVQLGEGLQRAALVCHVVDVRLL